MKSNERTYRINGTDKTFAELTTEEKIQLLTESTTKYEAEKARKLNTSSAFNKVPRGGWTDADRVK